MFFIIFLTCFFLSFIKGIKQIVILLWSAVNVYCGALFLYLVAVISIISRPFDKAIIAFICPLRAGEYLVILLIAFAVLLSEILSSEF